MSRRKINDHQFRAVSALPAADRYGHFIRQVADWQEVWSLRDDGGWRLVGDDDAQKCVPVWPHERYAAAYATGEFDGCRPEPIEVQRWLKEWLPNFRNDGRKIAVFHVGDGAERGVVVDPQVIEADLRAELSQYE
jgi:hypothetical protein